MVNIADLRKEREAAGLTQQELANGAGVTKAAISHYELGRRKRVAHTTMVALSRVLAKKKTA